MDNLQVAQTLKQQQDSLSNQLNKKQEDKTIRERPKVSQEPKKKKKVHLSFENEEADEPQTYKMTKNPVLNKENQLIKSDQPRKPSNGQNLEDIIKAEYLQKIQKLKQELIEFQYQFWQGGQMIKKLRRKKKEKVKQLLEVCRLQLVSSFKSLAQLSADDLLLVMKDFIVPHEMALYQIQALELKTKKNELLMNLRNVKIKKQGKQIILSVNIDSPIRIIQRIQYEKNKNNYPFCNWQTLKIASK